MCNVLISNGLKYSLVKCGNLLPYVSPKLWFNESFKGLTNIDEYSEEFESNPRFLNINVRAKSPNRLTSDPNISDELYCTAIDEIWKKYIANRKKENRKIILIKGKGPSELRNGSYRLGMTLGAGSFGRVFIAEDTKVHKLIALKMESKFADVPQLQNEAKVYWKLEGGPGIPKLVWAGKELDCNWLGIELLGPSLEYLFFICGRKFSIKTVLLIADQILSIIQFLHSKSLIHRDIKHANFCLGQGPNCNKIFILDFGMTKVYPEDYFNRKDTQCVRMYKYMIGTELFCGINTHLGLIQSMRDDMESIGYMLIYLRIGTLPWAGLSARTEKELEEKIKQCKMNCPLSRLCLGCPAEFMTYMTHVKGLHFKQYPDYKGIRQVFRNLACKLNIKYDFMYDWVMYRIQPQL